VHRCSVLASNNTFQPGTVAETRTVRGVFSNI